MIPNKSNSRIDQLQEELKPIDREKVSRFGQL